MFVKDIWDIFDKVRECDRMIEKERRGMQFLATHGGMIETPDGNRAIVVTSKEDENRNQVTANLRSECIRLHEEVERLNNALEAVSTAAHNNQSDNRQSDNRINVLREIEEKYMQVLSQVVRDRLKETGDV